jgi:chemotaxis signal transduction protein/DNA-binding XRE family transcriptional regulator
MAGSLIREARRRAGISQRELARRAGTSQPAVARIEAGRQSPGHATLARLVAACGLELRYELAAADTAEAGPLVEGQLLVVEAGGAPLGLAVSGIRSVERWAEPLPLPRAAPGVLGLVAVHGRMVTVLDPVQRLGAAGEVAAPTALVVCEAANGAYGLAVDTVVGLMTPPPGAVQPPPAVLGSPPAVIGMALLDSRVVSVLDPGRLIPNPRPKG